MRVESAKEPALSSKRTKRSAIAELPSDVSVGPHKIGKSEYWRVRLGSRFTGGKRVEMHFPSLDKARKWIFGDAETPLCPGNLFVLIREPLSLHLNDP